MSVELEQILDQNHIRICIADDIIKVFFPFSSYPHVQTTFPRVTCLTPLLAPFSYDPFLVVIISHEPLPNIYSYFYNKSMEQVLGVIEFKVAAVCWFVEGSMILRI